MKALLLKEYKKLYVTDVPKPKFGPNEVLVQIKACGICGSDIHGFDGSSGRRVPPLIMGHEASGIQVWSKLRTIIDLILERTRRGTLISKAKMRTHVEHQDIQNKILIGR